MRKIISGLAVFCFQILLICSASAAAPELDSMEPAIHVYADQGPFGERNLSCGDEAEFWSRLRMFAIFDEQYSYRNGLTEKNGRYTKEEVLDICYSIFNDFDGELPVLNPETARGIQMTGTDYCFMMATPREQQLELLSYRDNEDGSVDAAYALKHRNFKTGGFEETYRHYVHLVPNEKVNLNSYHPLYYRIAAMTSEITENAPQTRPGEDIQSDPQRIFTDYSEMLGKKITDIEKLLDPGSLEKRTESYYILNGSAADGRNTGVFLTVDEAEIITQVEVNSLSLKDTILGIRTGMAVSDAIRLLQENGYTFLQAGSTNGTLYVWAEYGSETSSVSFVTSQHAVHGTVTAENQMDQTAKIESVTISGTVDPAE